MLHESRVACGNNHVLMILISYKQCTPPLHLSSSAAGRRKSTFYSQSTPDSVVMNDALACAPSGFFTGDF